MPESSSRAIVENDGYIWIATQNGLVRYDGYQYKIYPLGNNRTNLLPTNNSRKPPTGEGTGLGLSLSCDIIVKGHRGKIEVQSVEGEYSEFKVLLPVM